MDTNKIIQDFERIDKQLQLEFSKREMDHNKQIARTLDERGLEYRQATLIEEFQKDMPFKELLIEHGEFKVSFPRQGNSGNVILLGTENVTYKLRRCSDQDDAKGLYDELKKRSNYVPKICGVDKKYILSKRYDNLQTINMKGDDFQKIGEMLANTHSKPSHDLDEWIQKHKNRIKKGVEWSKSLKNEHEIFFERLLKNPVIKKDFVTTQFQDMHFGNIYKHNESILFVDEGGIHITYKLNGIISFLTQDKLLSLDEEKSKETINSLFHGMSSSYLEGMDREYIENSFLYYLYCAMCGANERGIVEDDGLLGKKLNLFYDILENEFVRFPIIYEFFKKVK